jgi:hypothetical protein
MSGMRTRSGTVQRCACGKSAEAGECETCRARRVQRKPGGLSVNRPGDRFEHEAERAAEAVMRGGARPSFSLTSLPIVQREDKPQSDEEKAKEAAKKIGEAFLETPLGKKLIEDLKADPLVKGAKDLGEKFIATWPGKIITGAAAVGAVSALAAAGKPLPAQPPDIPLSFIKPGLSVKITYEGPVNNPTSASISFSYSEQSDTKAKPKQTEAERYRAETARIAADQARFRAGLRTDAERARDDADAKAALSRVTGTGGIDIDAIIARNKGLQQPTVPGAPQLTMAQPSFGYKPPSLLGDEYKLKPIDPRLLEPSLEERKKKDEKFGVQRAASGEAASNAPASVDTTLESPGQPLDSATRSFMEARFGVDFSQVRVHNDVGAASSAQDISAYAYTVGDDIVFGSGQYAPDTPAGRRLLAHELAHVVQQGGARRGIQRYDMDNAPYGDPKRDMRLGANAKAQDTPGVDAPALAEAAADEAEGTGAVGGRVKRIVIAQDEGMLIIETSSMSYLYELDNWNVPLGSYTTTVTIVGKTVIFDFGQQASGRVFHFNYRINRGQENPATLLKGQSSVTIDVVPSVTINPSDSQPLSCLLPLPNHVLIDPKKFSRPLFKPFTKNQSWTIGEIPLGYFGWISVDLTAGISASGLLSGGYGPGDLTDICLFRKLDRDRFAGSARFKFGAAIGASVEVAGAMEISGNYLSALPVASAGGKITAKAAGALRGGIDSRIDIIYNRRTGAWALDAEALISGSASLKVTATASASAKLLMKEIWSEQWKLVDRDFGIAWQGGLRVGTDTKPRFDFGTVGVMAQNDPNAPPTQGPVLPTATAPDPLATEAQVDTQNMMAAAVNTNTGNQSFPRGETEDDPLPIVWYKPLNIYPKELDIPRAITPHKLDRDDGPTPVQYKYGRSSTVENIGVGTDDETGQSNWPRKRQGASDRGKTFQLIERTAGDSEKDRLRDVFADRLLADGQTLRGLGYDVDHVHEKQFGGKDALPNLWPAKFAENQRAGGRHDHQLNEYRLTIGNIAGHWFEIVDIQMP